MDTTAKQMLLLTVDDVKKMREEMERLKRQVADLLINVFPMQQQIARMVERQNGLEALWVSELSVRMEKEKEKEVEKPATSHTELLPKMKMVTVEVPKLGSRWIGRSVEEAMKPARDKMTCNFGMDLGDVIVTTEETFSVVWK